MRGRESKKDEHVIYVHVPIPRNECIYYKHILIKKGNFFCCNVSYTRQQKGSYAWKATHAHAHVHMRTHTHTHTPHLKLVLVHNPLTPTPSFLYELVIEEDAQ